MYKSLSVTPNAQPMYEKLDESSNRGSFVDYSVQDYASIGNTCPTTSNRLATGSRGVDKAVIHVGFVPETIVIYDFLYNLGIQSSTSGEQFLGGQIALPGLPTVHVKWRESLMPNGKARYKLRIEFNPSDFTEDSSRELCPFEELPNASEKVIRMLIKYGDPGAEPDFLLNEETGEHFSSWPSNWVQNVLCSRLDLAQDFIVSDPRFHVAQLKNRRPKYARGVANYINGKRVNTVTHPASDKGSVIKIYDKYEERKKRSTKEPIKVNTKGHVRFEVMMKYKDLKSANLLTLANCQPLALTKQLEEYWQKSNYGHPLFSEEHLIDELLGRGIPLSEATQIHYYLVCREKGLCFPLIPDRVLREMRRLMKELGLRISDGLEQQNFTYGYLDLEQQLFITTAPLVQPFSLAS